MISETFDAATLANAARPDKSCGVAPAEIVGINARISEPDHDPIRSNWIMI
jgi:hypothetical protein